MKTFFIQYECMPKSGSSTELEYSGAYFSGWVKAKSLNDAKLMVSIEIERNDWVISQLSESFEIDHSYSPDEESLECLKQASIDGECYAIDAWENNRKSTSSVH